MFELLALTALIYLFLSRTKKKRKPRSLDAELKHLIQDSSDSTAISLEIKRYLLDVINDDKNDACLLYTSPSPRDRQKSRMPSSA